MVQLDYDLGFNVIFLKHRNVSLCVVLIMVWMLSLLVILVVPELVYNILVMVLVLAHQLLPTMVVAYDVAHSWQVMFKKCAARFG